MNCDTTNIQNQIKGREDVMEMRLIDADELMEHIWRDRLDSRERIANLVESMPTVEYIPAMSGWICPVCGRGLSPFTSVCPCKMGKGWEITC